LISRSTTSSISIRLEILKNWTAKRGKKKGKGQPASKRRREQRRVVNAKYETNQAACEEEQQAAKASLNHETILKR
jgi:hypothetical protein